LGKVFAGGVHNEGGARFSSPGVLSWLRRPKKEKGKPSMSELRRKEREGGNPQEEFSWPTAEELDSFESRGKKEALRHSAHGIGSRILVHYRGEGRGDREPGNFSRLSGRGGNARGEAALVLRKALPENLFGPRERNVPLNLFGGVFHGGRAVARGLGRGRRALVLYLKIYPAESLSTARIPLPKLRVVKGSFWCKGLLFSRGNHHLGSFARRGTGG